jgi:hypothetical protein
LIRRGAASRLRHRRAGVPFLSEGRTIARFERSIADAGERAGWADMALLVVFLIGLYTHYTIQIAAHVPFPSAPAGIAGMAMLVRQRNRVTPLAAMTLIGVILLYLVSLLCATDMAYLGRRFNGLIQLVYSLVIGFAAFLTITRASRRQIAALFLGFSLVILIGCLLEDYAGLRPISDWVRERLYSRGIYDSDLRDEILYGAIRPKFFASEPAAVTFAYSLFLFIWLVASRLRGKLVVYVALVGIGIFAMPGPTLLLMLLLILPYELFLAGRDGDGAGRSQESLRLLKFTVLACGLVAAVVVLSQTVFAARLKDIVAGNDASFFYRVLGPALAARDILLHYPIAGAGLTGEPFVEKQIVDVYAQSPNYSVAWTIVSPATELLINYFWLHWIYLGLVWGVVMIAAVTAWLKVLDVPSPAFCWFAWAILGQASGAYVGPLAWSVLYFTGAAAVLHRHSTAGAPARRARYADEPPWRHGTAGGFARFAAPGSRPR